MKLFVYTLLLCAVFGFAIMRALEEQQERKAAYVRDIPNLAPVYDERVNRMVKRKHEINAELYRRWRE